MLKRQSVIVFVLLASSLIACKQAELKLDNAPQAADATARRREDDFRSKERCAVAAERIDKLYAAPASSKPGENSSSVSEVFYSPARNSCVCEVATTGSGGKYITSLLTLYDCLSREDLGETLIQFGGTDTDQRLEAWKRKKAALK